MSNVFDIKTRKPVLPQNTKSLSFIVSDDYIRHAKSEGSISQNPLGASFELYSRVNKVPIENLRAYVIMFNSESSIDFLRKEIQENLKICMEQVFV